MIFHATKLKTRKWPTIEEVALHERTDLHRDSELQP